MKYFNVEIVSTHLQGIYACASANGTSPLLRTGWPQTAIDAPGISAACTCDNNASAHLHCTEVQLSLPQDGDGRLDRWHISPMTTPTRDGPGMSGEGPK